MNADHPAPPRREAAVDDGWRPDLQVPGFEYRDVGEHVREHRFSMDDLLRRVDGH